MTGREKILAAFTAEGSPETGVVACYDSIFIRDHYAALTAVPWWDPLQTDLLARDYYQESGLEWFTVNACQSRAERSRQRFEKRLDGVWRVDTATGEATRLIEPTPSGTNTACATSLFAGLDLPETQSAIDAMIPPVPEFKRDMFLAEGRQDVAVAVRRAVDLMLYSHIGSPLWALYGLFGYEGMMVLLAQNPALAAYAGRKILANTTQRIRMIAALGADAVWIEECITDQISPALFRQLNVPLVSQCVREISACGLKSIYYYCGNPNDRMDDIIAIGADAIHFEESKKGFAIDIAEIAGRLAGRCVLFGNLDAIGVLQNGSEVLLRSEIKRQLAAGKLNKNRFILSTGSPITPGTPLSKVRLYTDLARKAAQR